MGKQFNNVSSIHGAPMGRPDSCLLPSGKIHVFRVKFVDGDYDDGGAYWGGYPSEPLFCARDVDGNEMFVRARSYEKAVTLLTKHLEEPRT